MKKTVVKICMGTTCFVMGASELQELEELIPEKLLLQMFRVTGSLCIG